jgi:hypothetical protein
LADEGHCRRVVRLYESVPEHAALGRLCLGVNWRQHCLMIKAALEEIIPAELAERAL